MRLVVVGELGNHTTLPYVIALRRRGHEVIAVDVTPAPLSDAWALDELKGVTVHAVHRDREAAAAKALRRDYLFWAIADKARGPLRPVGGLASAAFGLNDRAARQRTAQWIRDLRPDAVFSTWGTIGYPELRALQRGPRDFALLHDWNTFPMGEERVGASGCNAVDRRIADRLDVRVHASRREQQFIEQRLRPRMGFGVVFPDGYSEVSRPRGTLPLLSAQDGEPHLVYHGNDPKPRRDHVGAQVRAVAEGGVHVHYATIRDVAEGSHPRLHRYAPFSRQEFYRGELFRFSTQFDACLVTIRVDQPEVRFEHWLPTRFLSGIASGIPVALRQGVLLACEDFLAENGNGFTFGTVEELKAVLSDAERMGALRKRARELEAKFVLERRLPDLEAAIARSVDARRGA